MSDRQHGAFRWWGGPLHIALFGIVLASIPWFLNGYWLSIAITALLLGGMTLAWNIIGGIGGQFSLAHSLFTACGGILCAALQIEFGIHPLTAMILAAVSAAILGAFISWVSFRFNLPRLTFALITLAFGEIGLIVILNTDFLGAANGLVIKRPPDAGPWGFDLTVTGYYFVSLVGVLIALFLVNWILTSRLGYYLRMIKIDDKLSNAMGIDTLRYKIIGMSISAAMSSLFATIYAQYLVYVDPYTFASPVLTIQAVLFASIGGLGTLWGPVVATGILVPVGEAVRAAIGGTASGLHFVIYGTIIVVMVLFMPDGITGGFIRVWKRIRKGRGGGLSR